MRKTPENPVSGRRPEEESPILTPSEIGALSPRVPRRAEMLREAPKPVEARIPDENGDYIAYFPEAVGEFSPETSIIKKGDRVKTPLIFKGRTKDGKVVLETEDGEGITIASQELEASYERSRRVYSERTKEGKEIKLDTEKVLRDSVEFYTAHELKDFLKELPKEVKLTVASEAKLKEALREGFDRAMLLPKAEFQAANIEQLAAETAAKEIPNFPANEQYAAPYFESGTKDSQTRNRPKQKAYLLLYQSGPIPEETKGLSPDDVPAQGKQPAKEGLYSLFKRKNWDGLTLAEQLILQRKEAEARKDHSFDAWDSDANKSQWGWLLDSRMLDKNRVPHGVVHACWYPRVRRLEVYWYEPGDSNARLGARPAVVVEVEV